MWLGSLVPDYDVEWHWDIADITTRWSWNTAHRYRCDSDIDLIGAWAIEKEECMMDEHFDSVLASLEQHGFTRPLTVTEDPWLDGRASPFRGELGLADGHHRLVAAELLGLKRVPVIRPLGLMPRLSPDSGGSWTDYTEVEQRLGPARPVSWFRGPELSILAPPTPIPA